MQGIALQTFKDWNEQLAQWCGDRSAAIDINRFATTLQRLVGCQSTQIIVYPQMDRPEIVVDTTPQTLPAVEMNPLYLEGAYLLDPFYRVGIQGDRQGLVRLRDVAPEGIEQSEYYRSYYKKTHIVDEACFLCPTDDCLIIAALVHLEGEPHFAPEELAVLDAATAVALRILHAWWQQQENKGSDANLRQYMEAALAHFGDSILTGRESEIVHSMLKGHTIKSLADHFNISIDTVKHHRKNIYNKLRIGSQTELFDLFVNAIKAYDPNKSPDPLFSFYTSD